ncbi:hypothetical protein D3C72_706390 [compost metagenome]
MPTAAVPLIVAVLTVESVEVSAPVTSGAAGGSMVKTSDPGAPTLPRASTMVVVTVCVPAASDDEATGKDQVPVPSMTKVCGAPPSNRTVTVLPTSAVPVRALATRPNAVGSVSAGVDAPGPWMSTW